MDFYALIEMPDPEEEEMQSKAYIRAKSVDIDALITKRNETLKARSTGPLFGPKLTKKQLVKYNQSSERNLRIWKLVV